MVNTLDMSHSAINVAQFTKRSPNLIKTNSVCVDDTLQTDHMLCGTITLNLHCAPVAYYFLVFCIVFHINVYHASHLGPISMLSL